MAEDTDRCLGAHSDRGIGRRGVVLSLAVILFAILIPPVRVCLWRSVELLATGQLSQFQHYLRSLGAWAPVLSIALMAAAAVAIPMPVAILMVANGLVFGLVDGMAVSLAGALLGAIIAYTIGRRLGRPLVVRFLPAASLESADRLMVKYGNWAIVLGRLLPGVPCDPVSYAAGLTNISPALFLLLTLVGLIPATLATAFLGVSEGGDVPARYWVSSLLLIAGVWTAWRLLRRRRTTATPL